MAQRLHRSGRGSTKVPSGAVLLCDRIEEIKAQKGNRSNWPNEFFKHKFIKENGKIYSIGRRRVPNNAQLIYDRIESIKGRGFNRQFRSGKIYGLSNGTLMITSPQGNLMVVSPHSLWDTFRYPS